MAPIFLTEQDVVEFGDMPSVVAALRDAFAAQARGMATNVPRSRADVLDRRLNLMAGADKNAKRYAIKAYGGSTYHVLLYGVPQGLLAVMEASALGAIRTGAASGVATEKMARPNAGKVALIGAGKQARTQAQALKAVGRLNELAVFARDRAKLEAACGKLAEELRVPVRAAASGEDAVAGADVVVTATGSATPVLMSQWLAPGTHVNAMGANAGNRREVEAEIVLRSALVVTDDVAQAKLEAGEFIDLAKAGRFDWSRVKTLAEVVAAPTLPRAPDAITLFKSLGVGLEDLAMASLVYDRALASGRFKPL